MCGLLRGEALKVSAELQSVLGASLPVEVVEGGCPVVGSGLVPELAACAEEGPRLLLSLQ